MHLDFFWRFAFITLSVALEVETNHTFQTSFYSAFNLVGAFFVGILMLMKIRTICFGNAFSRPWLGILSVSLALSQEIENALA